MSATQTQELSASTTLQLRASGLEVLTRGLDYLFEGGELPEHPGIDERVPHSPVRTGKLSESEKHLAIANALRYFPKRFHKQLAKEFAEELKKYNHIYMYRFRPTEYNILAHPIDAYPAKCKQAAAIMLMIHNNLDPKVAQFPHELITYGGNGSVFQNWAQYLLTMKYLSQMNQEQTLIMASGHPQGLFPSHETSPRLVITNGMVIPNYSSKEDYDRMHALGVTMYGQMTAGSYCYIGPQGIVHGTTLTVLNAARKYLDKEDMSGIVFLTSGLGGMSGAQPKAATICGAVGVIAEVSEAALDKRLEQGWVKEKISSLDECVSRMREAKKNKESTSIGYFGNIVELWEELARIAEETGEVIVDLGSDQTSCHNPFNGGYYPVQLSFEESNRMMTEDPEQFKKLVQESLRRQIKAINILSKKGLRFWDYGNSFLLEAGRAGADVMKEGGKGFTYPSYVEDIMGDIFSLGFGPFRWVCTSGKEEDLDMTDQIAGDVIEEIAVNASTESKLQYKDNLLWIRSAKKNQMVVGSQARILYSDAVGRNAIAQAFNKAVKEGKISAPVVISRDHHDVSGTDSPYRETSNITDGSMFCADMAVQNCIGDAIRGATWVAIHNGGGVGFGEAINGGFGLVLDGSEQAENAARSMLFWDVNNGVARRAWGRNQNALSTIKRAMEQEPRLAVTIPELADDDVIASAFE
uniref:urocanate hydratase n=1 Tax=Vannella robusta TaxID=1487602 RepID=A0A7S4IV05_9EUKA|mmetsp:Transcript_9064/g.11211  ORF Transcript_9064/g.11211 Transcript_9064/m.11211 type:complete len:695 (+) Transcript_9064:63-2147(+)